MVIIKKELSEMTLEELWRLFPIELCPHDSRWKSWFLEEKRILQGILKGYGLIVSHVGSTAVCTIWAKPIVDVLIEIRQEDFDGVYDGLTGHNYICMNRGNGRMSFNKGYTPDGFAQKVFHIHVRALGDNDELYFRDYLIDHLDDAKKYEALKLGLWKRFTYNRDGYTEAKGPFVKQYTEKAKVLYKNRYERK